MNKDIKQDILSSEAPCFTPQQIKPNDLKINDGSKNLQDDTDGSKKIQETTSSSDPRDGDSSSHATQKFKLKWTATLENQFNKAIQTIGVNKVTPKKILKFMNLKFLTKAHVSSKLQKYRKTLSVKEEGMKKARIAMYPNLSSACGYINPQHSYNYNTRLGNNNLFSVQPGYGLGQSSSMMNNNAGLHDSFNYMNRRPAYDLSQTGYELFPRRGNLGFQNGMLPIKEEWRSIPGTSQAPMFGPYGTTNNVLGMNYNPTTSTMGSSYSGVRRDENGDMIGLGGIRVNGNGSFGGVRVHGPGNDSLQRISVHGNGHESLGGIRVHDTSNGSLNGIRAHGTGSVGGTRAHGTDTGYVDGINFHGTSNGIDSLGVNFGINWNFSNNTMSKNRNSTPMFPSALPSFLSSKDQSQNNLIAQTGGVIPALENPEIFNDHHDINEVFCDRNNYQFHQNQHQGNLTGVNFEAPTTYPPKDISSWSFDDGANNEEILKSVAANPEMYFPTQDVNITNQGNNHEEILNSHAANPEMYFPTQDVNITNQDCGGEDFLNYLLDPDIN